MIVDEVRKLKASDYDARPLEKLIVQLMQAMIAGGRADHPVFEELWCLLGEVATVDPDRDNLDIHLHVLSRKSRKSYIDMAEAERLYRQWRRDNPGERAGRAAVAAR